MTDRSFYSASIGGFMTTTDESIVGLLSSSHAQDLVADQKLAWRQQIRTLKSQLQGTHVGHVFFEFSIPRMGRRCDVVLYINQIVFVLEFKVGSRTFDMGDRRQVESYALDLKNFHSGSHELPIVPVLIATAAQNVDPLLVIGSFGVYEPVHSNGRNLGAIVEMAQTDCGGSSLQTGIEWSAQPYRPTPTIVEAAQALYANHRVEEIARSDAGAANLARTTGRLIEIAEYSRSANKKSLCFVTGVPGAGKTLVGLALATRSDDRFPAVFLSGNGPLVEVLREALIRDELRRKVGLRRHQVNGKVKQFIQNVHNFRDSALDDEFQPPHERVVIFDEAQRAWDLAHTQKFMQTKRGRAEFAMSEPQFLVDYVNRHEGWCVVVALIGGGQEINSGEIGLEGWRDAIRDHWDWDVYVSDRLSDPEYAAGDVDFRALKNNILTLEPDLHLSTSMRSFRAESMSGFVHYLLEGDANKARLRLDEIREQYPIRITRNLQRAKDWLSSLARGSDSKGVVASSGAMRLKPEGIFVKSEHSSVNWFLNGHDDVRSCHFLEEVATEFEIQGLELDWTLIAWDADLRYEGHRFEHWDFRGTRWQERRSEASRRYLTNAYRVLLTRARQGMVIFVPQGDASDETRSPNLYDGTYQYLLSCGIETLDSADLPSKPRSFRESRELNWIQPSLQTR